MKVRLSSSKIRFRIDNEELDALLAKKLVKTSVPVSNKSRLVFITKAYATQKTLALKNKGHIFTLMVPAMALSALQNNLSHSDKIEEVQSFKKGMDVKIVLEVDLHDPKRKESRR